MKKKTLCYVVEIAEYDFRKSNTTEARNNEVDTYEDFRIKGIYPSKEEATEKFTNLVNDKVKELSKSGAFNAMGENFDTFREMESDEPTPMSLKYRFAHEIAETEREEWLIYANEPTEYWICRNDNDIELRIRIREYFR